MKKSILMLLCGIVLVSTTACNNSNEDENVQNEKFMLGTTIDDGRLISFTFSVPYIKGNEHLYLDDSLLNGTITVEEFISKLEHIDTLRDGGSKIYKYNKSKKIFGDSNFYVISCNSTDGIHDVFIAKNKDLLLDKCSIKIDDLTGVSMAIKEGTLTRKSVIITDTSDRENIYGEFYKIEKKENNKWVELEPLQERFFNDIGYVVGEENTLQLDINWESNYGELENGEYRIVKDTSEAGEGTVHYLTVEFTIE